MKIIIIKFFTLAFICLYFISTSAITLAEDENFGFPVANFTTNVSGGYSPLSVQFTDLSENATELNWDFGDGINDSINRNPIHIYTSPRTYTVNLTAVNLNGTDSKLTTIIVLESKVLPVANFNSNITSGYAPLYVKFTYLSMNANGWNWNFGDGTNSIEQNPTHTYSTAGKYTVNLTVNNENGSDSKTLKIFVYNVPSKILPIANFTSNVTSGYAPLSVQFTDTSQNATARSWDFDKDGIADSSDAKPIYTYNVPGTYTVNLTVSNENGTNSKTATIIVMESSSGGSSSSDISGGSSSESSGSNSESGGSSSGSGGGGVGGSPEPQSNVETKELSQAFIASGSSVRFDFLQNSTPIVYVSFDSKKTAGKTTTIVEMLRGKSTLVPQLPSSEVYKDLNIWVGNSGFATPINIGNAVVCFKVDKSWIQDKNINKSTISLNWYSEERWNQLPTNQLSEDDKFMYFTAQTPGFSSFVITGNALGKEIVTMVQPASETKIQPDNMTENVVQTDIGLNSTQKAEKGKSMNLPVFGMICIIALILSVFIFKVDK